MAVLPALDNTTPLDWTRTELAGKMVLPIEIPLCSELEAVDTGMVVRERPMLWVLPSITTDKGELIPEGVGILGVAGAASGLGGSSAVPAFRGDSAVPIASVSDAWFLDASGLGPTEFDAPATGTGVFGTSTLEGLLFGTFGRDSDPFVELGSSANGTMVIVISLPGEGDALDASACGWISAICDTVATELILVNMTPEMFVTAGAEVSELPFGE
jgi:hypothetical protein